jgi:hypothetical protein
VAILADRSIEGNVTDWTRAESLPPLPPVHQVVRSSPGERSAIVAELLADLENELFEPLPEFING